jgi:hypothetical protein
VYPAIAQVESDVGRSSQVAVFFDMLDRYLRYPHAGEMTCAPFVPYLDVDIAPENIHFVHSDQDWGPYKYKERSRAFEREWQAFDHWWHGGAWGLNHV